jgi:hypothetical protein
MHNTSTLFGVHGRQWPIAPTTKPTMVVDFALVSRIYFSAVPNERTFREHFGATPAVTAAVWEWLESEGLVPTKALPRHLLWLFFWWKSNALQARCCQFLGGIDKNTFIKWRDAMEEAVSNLPVVCNNFISYLASLTLCINRLIGMTGSKISRTEIVQRSLWTALISRCKRPTHLNQNYGLSSIMDQGYGTKLVFVSIQG